MGHKLTDGNAAIADLSDSNRPNKIGERYGELYDNQWTDAYEIFSKEYDEKKTVAKLIQILVVSFSFFFSIIVLFSSEQASVFSSQIVITTRTNAMPVSSVILTFI